VTPFGRMQCLTTMKEANLKSCQVANGVAESRADLESSAGSAALDTGRLQQVSRLPAGTVDSPSLHSVHKVAMTEHHCCREPDQVDAGW